MGKKKSRSRADYKYEAEDAEEEPSDSNFAAKLLSTMNISGKEEVTEADEEAVEVEDESEEQEIKHPHLHQIHKSISRVFRKDSSSSSSRKDSASSNTKGPSSPRKSNSQSYTSVSNLEADSTGTTSASQVSGTKLEESMTEDPAEETSSGSTDANAQEPLSGTGKKRNRRKEKLAERERERARIVQQAQAEAQTVPDKRAIELKGMGMMISNAGLEEFEMQPDGHCLFHSLIDQLKQRYDIEVSVEELRTGLANFIRAHPDDFVPYLVEDESGDVIDIDKYTNDLENTPLWGGELEIMAASRKYEVPVRVYFASQPPLTVNEEQFPSAAPLTIAYYQAKFGLGAHYNSLRDAKSATAA